MAAKPYGTTDRDKAKGQRQVFLCICHDCIAKAGEGGQNLSRSQWYKHRRKERDRQLRKEMDLQNPYECARRLFYKSCTPDVAVDAAAAVHNMLSPVIVPPSTPHTPSVSPPAPCGSVEPSSPSPDAESILLNVDDSTFAFDGGSGGIVDEEDVPLETDDEVR